MPKFTQARQVRNLRQGWHLFRNRRTMWQMIRAVAKGHYRMSFFSTLIIIACAVYVLIPFDLIPDYIPVVGWVDDGVALYLLLKILNNETQRFIRFKASERRRQVY